MNLRGTETPCRLSIDVFVATFKALVLSVDDVLDFGLAVQISRVQWQGMRHSMLSVKTDQSQMNGMQTEVMRKMDIATTDRPKTERDDHQTQAQSKRRSECHLFVLSLGRTVWRA